MFSGGTVSTREANLNDFIGKEAWRSIGQIIAVT